MPHVPSKYLVDGVRVPSVTQVLKRAGLIDLSMIQEQVLFNAMLIGTETHEWCDLLDRGEEACPSNERVAGRVAAYQKFRADTDFVAEGIEEPVINRTYRYAGTPDRWGVFNGKNVVLDLKPPHGNAPWVGLQLAGYARALVDMGVAAWFYRYSLSLRDNGTYKLHEFKDRSDYDVFLAAVTLAHWKIEHKVDS